MQAAKENQENRDTAKIIYQSPKQIALTFDDGPDPEYTIRVLNMLSYYDVKATFMCVGTLIDEHPQVMKQIVKDGHIVCNHGWDHTNLTTLSTTDVHAQIKMTADAINRVTGLNPRLFRPPYGELNHDVVQEIASLDNSIILWNIDSLDWKEELSGPQIASNILAEMSPGSIILLHCQGKATEGTLQALPYVIEVLYRQGYSFVTIPEMLHIPAYHSD